MRCFPLVLLMSVLTPCPAAAASGPANAPSTRPALIESKPVVNDGVAVVVALKQQAIPTHAQPRFTVRFTNVAGDYINLYDVDAYCDWNIEFTSAGKAKDRPRSLALKMDKIPHRIPIAHRQIKPGESTEVEINLGDPPFTFHYEDAHPAEGVAASKIRHLDPGTWQVALTVQLKHPFGPGHHEWEGPLTTWPVELIVGPANPDADTGPTPGHAAAYSAAIHRQTDAFGGLSLNGGFPEIRLPADAPAEDVIEAAVNQTMLDGKAYRILRVEPFAKDGLPENVSGSAALVQVGKAYKVVIFFPFRKSGWWSRFYDAELSPPTAAPK